jgi:hypothetical protein
MADLCCPLTLPSPQGEGIRQSPAGKFGGHELRRPRSVIRSSFSLPAALNGDGCSNQSARSTPPQGAERFSLSSACAPKPWRRRGRGRGEGSGQFAIVHWISDFGLRISDICDL